MNLVVSALISGSDKANNREGVRVKTTLWKLATMACLLLSSSAVMAAENSPHYNAGGVVLGQEQNAANAATQSQATSGAEGQGAAGRGEGAQEAASSGGAAPKDAAAKREQVQKLFEESLRQMMPLSEGQIQQYREWSDKRDRALMPVSPDLRSRTVRVALEPGKEPVRVATTANVATSLLVHDATGQPWPITSVTNGAPALFQVLRPEIADANLLNILPTQPHGSTTLVVSLEKQDIPLVVRLESDSVRGVERKADALVLLQIAQHGPRASVPLVEETQETVTSAMMAFLDHVPPDGATRVGIKPALDATEIWKFGDAHYVRTRHTLVWPAWTAVVNGAGSVKCYELPVTSRIMVSKHGKVQSLVLHDAPFKRKEREQ